VFYAAARVAVAGQWEKAVARLRGFAYAAQRPSVRCCGNKGGGSGEMFDEWGCGLETLGE
jgi:hypothetical protein